MIHLDSKGHFLQHDEIKRELATVVQSNNFHFALNFALTQFVLNATPTSDEIKAVRLFIDTLLNLPFKEQSPATVMHKTLHYTGAEKAQPEPKK
jgi:hypothetical protein